VTNKEYHSRKGFLSASGLKTFAKSPAHFQFAMQNFTESTPAMKIGTATHTLTLEPENSHEILIEPGNKQTKAGKLAWAEMQATATPDQTILSPKDYALASAMADAVHSHLTVKTLFENETIMESSIFVHDDEIGIDVKIRPDCLIPDLGICLDLKTTDDASADRFKWTIKNYRYHWQAAFYLKALAVKYPGQYKHFVFLAVEKKKPHGVSLFSASQQILDDARWEMKPILDQYADCLKNDTWPGYPTEIQNIFFHKGR